MSATPGEIRIVPLAGLPEVCPGDDLASLVGDAVDGAGGLEAGDVLVVAHKVVSKSEGRFEPEEDEHAVILREARAVRRRRGELVIAETRHGFVCASAGVDHSNAGKGELVLLPDDPDASARALRDALAARFAVALAVIVSDSFGRAWRQGTTDVAIGAAGLAPLLDLRGTLDAGGRELRSTVIAVADELAGAAELVMGKASGIPAALVRGYAVPPGDGSARELVMPRDRDLFP